MQTEHALKSEYDWMVGNLVRVQYPQDNTGRVAREFWDEFGLVVGVHECGFIGSITLYGCTLLSPSKDVGSRMATCSGGVTCR